MRKTSNLFWLALLAAAALLFASCSDLFEDNGLDIASMPGVTNLTATATDETVTLDWTKPDDKSYDGAVIVVTDDDGNVVKTVTVDGKDTETAVIEGLTNDTNYHFTVTPKNTADEVAAPETAAVVPAEPVSDNGHAPTELNVTDLTVTGTDGNATLTWKNTTDTTPADTTDDLTKIKVKVYDEDGNLVEEKELDGTPVPETVTFDDLDNNTEYTFHVISVDPNGKETGGVTRNDIITSENTVKPNDATDISATDKTPATAKQNEGVVVVSWTNPSDSDYDKTFVTVCDKTGKALTNPTTGYVWKFVVDGEPSGADTQKVTGLTRGETYNFKVQTRDTHGNVSTGRMVPVTISALDKASTISNVTNLTFDTDTNGNGKINWTNPTEDAYDHAVVTVYDEDGNVVYGPVTVDEENTSAYVTGLDPNKPYVVVVVAVDTSDVPTTGVTALNDITTADIVAPGDITNLVAVGGDKEVDLTWTKPKDADYDGVVINIYDDTGKKIGTKTITGDPTVEAAVFKNNDTLDDNTTLTLNNGSTYTFKVHAKDPAGNQSTGESTTATPTAPTAAQNVTDLTVTPGDGKVTLTWTNPTGTTGTKIYVYDDDGKLVDTVDAGTDPTKTIEGLTNGEPYTFKVVTTTDSGTSTGISKNGTPVATLRGVTITVNKDGTPWKESGKTVALYTKKTSTPLADSDKDGTFTGSVGTGTYDVYVDGVDTGVNFTVVAEGDSSVVDFYTITVPTVKGATVAPNGTSTNPVVKNGSYTFTVTPDKGFTLDKVTVKTTDTTANKETELTPAAINTTTGAKTYTITDITGPNTIAVTGVAVPNVTNVTATPDDASIIVTWTQPTGTTGTTIYVYDKDGKLVDTVDAGTDGTQTITGLTNGETYTAKVVAKTGDTEAPSTGDDSNITTGALIPTAEKDTVTVSVTKDGSTYTGAKVELYTTGATPTLMTKLTEGTTAGSYTDTVAPGTYKIFVDGKDTGVTVTVSKESGTVTVDLFSVTTPTTVQGASVNPAGKTTVVSNGIFTFTVTPADGCSVDEAVVSNNGTPLTATTTDTTTGAKTYTITPVTGKINITVTGVTRDVAVTVKKDGAAFTGKTVALYSTDETPALRETLTEKGTTGVYNGTILPGTYKVYVDGKDTGKTFAVTTESGSTQIDYFTVSSTGSGVTITPTGTSTSPVVSGTKYTFTVSLNNECTGTPVVTVNKDTTPLTPVSTNAGTTTYEITVTGKTAITVTGVTAKTYTVTVPPLTNATVTAVSKNPAESGTTFEFTVTPNSGYTLDNATVTATKNGTDVPLTLKDTDTATGKKTYTFTVTGDTTISVDGVKSRNSITVTYKSGDISISVSGTTITAKATGLEDGKFKWYFNRKSTVVSEAATCTVGNGLQANTSGLTSGFYELTVTYTTAERTFTTYCQVQVQ